MAEKIDSPTPTEIELHGEQAFAINLQCFQCQHFKGPKAAKFSDTCDKLGIIPESKVCDSFKPDIRQIGRVKEVEFLMLFNLIKKNGAMGLSTLAAYFNMVAKQRKAAKLHHKKFKPGSIVWFLATGEDRLENYRRGFVEFVSGTTGQKTMVNIVHMPNLVTKALLGKAVVEESRVYSMSEWETKLAQLKELPPLIPNPNKPILDLQRDHIRAHMPTPKGVPNFKFSFAYNANIVTALVAKAKKKQKRMLSSFA